MPAVTLSRLVEECDRLRATPAAEMVDVADAVGRTLAADLRALVAIPALDVAATDGIAVRAADTPGLLSAMADSVPGHEPPRPIDEGQAVRVAAGSPLPRGADTVVPLAEAGTLSGMIEIRGDHDPGEHVRRSGEVIMEGVLMLHAGMVVPATAVAAMAAVGHARIPVLARPRVAVVSVGDGMLPLGSRLRPWQRIDANPVGLAAQIVAAGATVARSVSVENRQDAVVSAYTQARARQGAFDRAAFDEAFAIMAAQRNAKVLGIFVRLNKRDGKPVYMRHLPRCRTYFALALRHPSLSPVARALQEIGLAEALEA